MVEIPEPLQLHWWVHNLQTLGCKIWRLFRNRQKYLHADLAIHTKISHRGEIVEIPRDIYLMLVINGYKCDCDFISTESATFMSYT